MEYGVGKEEVGGGGHVAGIRQPDLLQGLSEP